MEHDYNQPEDFASDDSFVNYCFHNNTEDVRYWKKWLKDHPDKRETARRAREMIFIMSVKISPEKKQKEWEKIRPVPNQIIETYDEKPPRGGTWKKVLTFGGIAIFIIALGSAGWWFMGTSSSHQNSTSSGKMVSLSDREFKTVPGQQRKIILEDGTQVWLNADSKLTSSDFDHTAKREVSLSGEAYFDVSHDPSRPFIIHANNMDITVLGTAFNVKAYPDDKTMETTLINGSIEITLADDASRRIKLKPNEKLTVFNKDFQLTHITTSRKLSPPKDSTAEFAVSHIYEDPLLDSGTVETSWMNGILAFRSERFDELAKKMERKYNVNFHFDDEDIKGYRFTGTLSTETFNQALHALKLTSPSAPFNYTIEGKEVYVEKDKR